MGRGTCVQLYDDNLQKITIHKEEDNFDEGGKKDFNLDRIFPWTCSQKDVYEFAGRPVVESVL